MTCSLTIPGSSVFSSFRLASLQTSLGARAVRAIWIHYIHLHRQISSEAEQNLKQFLKYGADLKTAEDPFAQTLLSAVSGHGGPLSSDTQIYYVTPRLGTISPWSSKATSIAHVCGLEGDVKRIERGMAVAVTFPGPRGDDDFALADSFYDRMTHVSVSLTVSPFR